MKHPRLGRAGWRWVQLRARALLRDPGKVQALLDDAELKPKQRLGEAKQQLATLLRLLKAWLSGRYRRVSTSTLVAAVAAVLYFVLPLDLIPDFILGLGLVDDIAVIAWVLNQFRSELQQFCQWERSQLTPDTDADAAKPSGEEPATSPSDVNPTDTHTEQKTESHRLPATPQKPAK